MFRNKKSKNDMDDFGGGIAVAGGAMRAPKTSNEKADYIKKMWFLRHFNGNPNTYIVRYKNGTVAKEGKALSFYFRELNTAIVEVPTANQELPFLITLKSSDFQDVTIQGVLTYTVVDDAPATIADHIDFSVDLKSGRYNVDPRVKIESFLHQLISEHLNGYTSNNSLMENLQKGAAAAKSEVAKAIEANSQVIDNMGLEIVMATVASVKARADIEKSLQVPTFESLQEKADQATFGRRAKAVAEERSIQEAESLSQLSLAQKQEALIAQQGTNARKKAEEDAVAHLVATQSEVERLALTAESRAENTRLQGEAAADAEKAILNLYTDLHPGTLTRLAIKSFAENLANLSHLSITDDVLSGLITQLGQAHQDA